MDATLGAESNLRTLVEALQARKSGSGWAARCPAHDDNTPSLSLAVSDGKLLVHCHAGCTQENVLATLRERGLWKATSPPLGHPAVWGDLVATYDYVDEQNQL